MLELPNLPKMSEKRVVEESKENSDPNVNHLNQNRIVALNTLSSNDIIHKQGEITNTIAEDKQKAEPAQKEDVMLNDENIDTKLEDEKKGEPLEEWELEFVLIEDEKASKIQIKEMGISSENLDMTFEFLKMENIYDNYLEETQVIYFFNCNLALTNIDDENSDY